MRYSIGTDGTVSNVKVVSSSHSALVDDAVVSAVQGYVYEPAIGFDGQPYAYDRTARYTMAQWAQGTDKVPFMGGLKTYTCDAFNKEFAFWKANNPTLEAKEYPFRKTMLGLLVMAGMRGTGDLATRLLMQTRTFDARWNKMVGTCAKKPKKKVIDELF